MMAAAVMPRGGDRLGAYALFAAVLSGAGLPIYIYAPKYFADTYGVSLATLGAVLFGLRLFDVVQDPVLGWISERLHSARGAVVAGFAALLAVSMLGLFAVAPPVAPVWWFGLTITGLFTAFSFLTINFYGRGVAKAGEIQGGHARLAGWRETGALLGVCAAAVTPSLLTGAVDAPFAVFAIGFSGSSSLKVGCKRRAGKAHCWCCSSLRQHFRRRYGRGWQCGLEAETSCWWRWCFRS